MKHNFDIEIPNLIMHSDNGNSVSFKTTLTHITINMDGLYYNSNTSRKISRAEIRSSRLNLIELAIEEMELELEEFERKAEQTEEFKNERTNY